MSRIDIHDIINEATEEEISAGIKLASKRRKIYLGIWILSIFLFMIVGSIPLGKYYSYFYIGIALLYMISIGMMIWCSNNIRLLKTHGRKEGGALSLLLTLIGFIIVPIICVCLFRWISPLGELVLGWNKGWIIEETRKSTLSYDDRNNSYHTLNTSHSSPQPLIQPDFNSSGIQKETNVQNTDSLSAKCDECGKYVLRSDLKRCKKCGMYVCSSCRKHHVCKVSIPNNVNNDDLTNSLLPGLIQCDECGKYFSKDELKKCKRCGMLVCPSCRKDHICNSKMSNPSYRNNTLDHNVYQSTNINEETASIPNSPQTRNTMSHITNTTMIHDNNSDNISKSQGHTELDLKSQLEALDISALTVAAENGDADAQVLLGRCYREGIGVQKDLINASRLFSLAAEQGHPVGQLALGVYYSDDLPEADYKNAAYWFSKSAEQGQTVGQYRLGKCYQQGLGVSVNPEKAFYWFTKAAEGGFAWANLQLLTCYLDGIGVEANRKKAFNCLIQAAEANVSEAQVALADFYNTGVCYEGLYIEQDYSKSFYWLTKAANQNDADAQRKLGISYYNGEGTDVNPEKAFYWFTKAAENNDTDVGYWLGYCYEEGTGTEINLEKAFYWFAKAAENGDEFSQYKLALCYQDGLGTVQDSEKAVYWFTKAAEQGHDNAQFYLGGYYVRTAISSSGISKDKMLEGVKWLTKAAEQDNAYAQTSLGQIYEIGIPGVIEMNLDKAIELYVKAEELGNEEAKKALDKLMK